jgi:hypothetical protein
LVDDGCPPDGICKTQGLKYFAFVERLDMMPLRNGYYSFSGLWIGLDGYCPHLIWTVQFGLNNVKSNQAKYISYEDPSNYE